VRAHFTAALAAAVSRGLFARHRLVFAALLAQAALAARGALDAAEWAFLLTGGAGESEPPPEAMPAPEWLSERAWRAVRLASRLPTLAGLAAAVAEAPGAWRAAAAGSAPLPGRFGALPPLPRAALARALRPDAVPAALAGFVADTLGADVVGAACADISPGEAVAAAFGISGPTTPISLLLAPEAPEPATELLGLAAERGMSERTRALSLGTLPCVCAATCFS
jgi:dynein heavy chain, axonemal